jgi:hypothetical protein
LCTILKGINIYINRILINHCLLKCPLFASLLGQCMSIKFCAVGLPSSVPTWTVIWELFWICLIKQLSYSGCISQLRYSEHFLIRPLYLCLKMIVGYFTTKEETHAHRLLRSKREYDSMLLLLNTFFRLLIVSN